MPKPEGLLAVARARLILNAIVVVSQGFLYLAWTATLSGAALLALELGSLFPSGVGALPVWAGLSILSFAFGAFMGFRRRLGRAAAAGWLDARLGSGELFSAAHSRDLALSSGGEPGRFDDEIMARAGLLAARARKPGFPLLAATRRTLLALGACLAFGVLLPAAEGGLGGGSGEGAMEYAKALAAAAAEAGGGKPISTSSARAVAEYLFPGDRAGAAAAERALREGRATDLRNLLKKARDDIDDRLDRGVSDRERRRLLEDRERLDEASSLAEEGGTDQGGDVDPGSAGESESQRGGSGEGGAAGEAGKKAAPPRPPSEGEGSGGDRQRGNQGGGTPPSAPPQGRDGGGKGGDPGAPSPGQGGGADRDSGSGGGAGSGGAGEGEEIPGKPGAGTGSGQQVLRAPIKPRAEGGDLGIAADPGTPFLDYVLPGQDPSAAIDRRAAASLRAAEAAVPGGELPTEYRQFIQSYFLSLVRRSAGEDGAEAKGAP